jgi:serine/threonine-protein kinase HipA
MNRKGNVYINNEFCGIVYENEDGYHFAYDKDYLNSENAKHVSPTLPLTDKTYHSNILFPFFDGLIPEGWLLDLAEKNWKLNYNDRMGLLLTCCKDCIGAVSVEKNEEL